MTYQEFVNAKESEFNLYMISQNFGTRFAIVSEKHYEDPESFAQVEYKYNSKEQVLEEYEKIKRGLYKLFLEDEDAYKKVIDSLSAED